MSASQTRGMSPAADDEPSVVQARSWLGPLLVLLLAATVIFYVQRWQRGQSRSERSGPAIGTRFGPFELEPLTDGTPPCRSDELRGSVVLVNFWGPWCHPCREEFPYLRAMADRLSGEQRFRLVSVASAGAADDGTDEIERLKLDTRRYLESRKANFPVYCDRAGQLRLQLIEKRRVNGFSFPTTVIIDSTGAIRGIWEGFLAGDELKMEELIRQLLKVDADVAAGTAGDMPGNVGPGTGRLSRSRPQRRSSELPAHV